MKSLSNRQRTLIGGALALVCGYGVATLLSSRKAVSSVPETQADAVEAPVVATSFSKHRDAMRQRDARLAGGNFRALLESPHTDADGREYLKRWSERDPEAAWDWYRNGGEAYDGSGGAPVILRAWFGKSPEDAIRALKEMGGWKASSLAGGLLSLFFSEEVGLAAAAEAHFDALLEMCEGWRLFNLNNVEPDLDTIARIKALPASDGRSRALSEIAEKWGQSDWKAATAWVASLPEAEKGILLPKVLNGMLGGISRVDEWTTERVDWIRKILTESGDSALRTTFGPKLVTLLGADSPEEALHWASANLSGGLRAHSIAAVLELQAKKDLSAAGGIVERLPPGGVRRTAAGKLFTTWMETDPAKAMEWVRAETAIGGDLSRWVRC